MCGIAGIISADGRASMRLGAEALSQIAHRGPDGAYLWNDGPAVMGTCRLAIVNVDGGIQPAFNETGDVVAVFNGEIYNHRELRTELSSRGHKIAEGSDIEVLPHALEEWGLDFPKHLNGQFGIAIWNRHTRELILARDRVGMKPLFFATARNGDLVFGSEVKSLFAHPGIERRIDERSVAQIFTLWTVVDSFSPFAGVQQVEAGSVYRFGPDRELKEQRKYWDIPFSGDLPALDIDFPTAKEAFRDELKRAVDLRLRADVPVGTYTSGGIDSSVVNVVAQKELNHSNTRTFSVQFANENYDESPFQNRLAQHLGLEHDAIRVTNRDVYRTFPKAVFHAESPIFRTAPVPMNLLSGLVRERGIKVVLTGEGADEVAWGYDIFRESKVRRFWSREPGSRVRPQLFRRIYSYLPQFQNPRYFNIAVDFFRKDLDRTDDPLYSHMTRIANSMATHSFFSKDVVQRIAQDSPLTDLGRSLPSGFADRPLLERCQYLEMRTLLPGYLLSSQGDRQQSAHGVEGRYPFLDHNLIELLARLRPSHKLRGLRDKCIVRETFEDRLPRELIDRPKFAYRAPEMEAFIDDEEGYVETAMSERAVTDLGIFDPEKVANLVLKMKTLKADRFSTRDNLAFVSILSTQLLHEMFVRDFERRKLPVYPDICIVRWDANRGRRTTSTSGSS